MTINKYRFKSIHTYIYTYYIHAYMYIYISNILDIRLSNHRDRVREQSREIPACIYNRYFPNIYQFVDTCNGPCIYTYMHILCVYTYVFHVQLDSQAESGLPWTLPAVCMHIAFWLPGYQDCIIINFCYAGTGIQSWKWLEWGRCAGIKKAVCARSLCVASHS